MSMEYLGNYILFTYLDFKMDKTKLWLEQSQELWNKNKFPHRTHSIHRMYFCNCKTIVLSIKKCNCHTKNCEQIASLRVSLLCYVHAFVTSELKFECVSDDSLQLVWTSSPRVAQTNPITQPMTILANALAIQLCLRLPCFERLRILSQQNRAKSNSCGSISSLLVVHY